MFQNDFMGTVSLTVDEIREASKVRITFRAFIINPLFIWYRRNCFVPVTFVEGAFGGREDDKQREEKRKEAALLSFFPSCSCARLRTPCDVYHTVLASH